MTTYPRRRWFRLTFGLRTLLVLVVVLALPLGWIANEWGQSRFEQRIADQLRMEGWEVELAGPWSAVDTYTFDGNPLSQSIVREVLGERIISLVGPKVGRSDLSSMRSLTNLQWVYIEDARYDELEYVTAITTLRWLNLKFSRISDVTSLSTLRRLEALILEDTAVSNLQPLANLSSLRYLNVRNTPVADLSPLAGLSKLFRLDLRQTSISDLKPLAKLSTLGDLRLSNTQITDITPLLSNRQLVAVRLEGTSVSDEQVAALRKALPQCDISPP